MTEETLKIIISAEIGKLKDELKKGKEEVEDFEKKSKGSFEEFSNIAQQASEKATNAIKGFGIAIAGISTMLLGLTASTEEYRANQAKLISAFESSGSTADQAKEVYNDLYRVLGEDDTAVEAANHLAKLTDSQIALKQWTEICQGVYATFGDSLPVEGLTEAVNHTVKLGEVQGNLADALEWSGVNVEEVNEELSKLSLESEREAYLRDMLNGLYSEASSHYEKNASEIMAQHEAEARLADQTAKLGKALAPVNTMLTELATDVLTALTPHIEKFMSEHGEELKNLLIEIGEAIGTAIGWIADNWDTITKIAEVIFSIIVAIKAINVVLGVYNGIMAIANAQTLALHGVFIAIIAIVAIFILCWDDIVEAVKKAVEAIKKAFEGIGEFFSGVFDSIVNAFDGIGDFFSNIFSSCVKDIKTIFSAVGGFFSEVVEGIKVIFSGIGTFFSDVFTSAVNGIKTAFSTVGSFFSNIGSGIKNIFSGIGSWFGNIFTGAVNAIKKAFSGIANFFQNIVNSITSIFVKIGTKIVDALTSAVKTAINAVLKAVAGVVNAVISVINGAITMINWIPGVELSKISEIRLPQLEKGGVVDSATVAMIGENGKEAVVPLENNLGWLDKLAGMLNDRMGGNAPIVLQVDGKTFAEISVNSINQLTRQKGSLPIKIM